MLLSDLIIAAGAFVLGFLFCAMLVMAWSADVGIVTLNGEGEE